MRINPYSNKPSVEQVSNNNNAAKSKPATTSVSAPSESDAFSRSNALSGLLSALRELPDVRTEVVARAQAQVESGELTTPGSAAETASYLDEQSNN